MPPLNSVELRITKTFRGREGQGYNGNLFMEGRKIASVIDEGSGGDPNIYYNDRRDREAFETWVKCLPDNVLDPGSEYPSFMESLYDRIELAIMMLVTAFEEEKRLKRMCRTKTLVKTKACQKGEYDVIKQPFTAELKPRIVAKYGDQLVEIVNERWG